MTQYVAITVCCPNCKTPLRMLCTISCNDFGGKSYTDGYVKALGWDPTPAYFICSKCGVADWSSSFERSTPQAEEVDTALDEAHEVEHCILRPPEDKYPDYVRHAVWRDTHEEVYIRMRALWTWNHPFRNHPPPESEWPIETRANCERLLAILPNDDEPDILLLAELQRECGCFQEAIRLLDRPFKGNRNRRADLIRNLAGTGDKFVALVPPLFPKYSE